jgi:hypothetical protein
MGLRGYVSTERSTEGFDRAQPKASRRGLNEVPLNSPGFAAQARYKKLLSDKTTCGIMDLEVKVYFEFGWRRGALPCWLRRWRAS